ncbi:MAG TPA: IS110 family transposase [Acidimicrobiales bacterium]|nr:IS110 family transposase [Acidimicrobiales bacterium]
MTVMIGCDPHKGSHTSVAVDGTEQSLAEIRVRSGPAQLERLLGWAARFPDRCWAVENATGLGYLLAQQLVAAGERVIDVQPKLAARVRLLDTQAVNKNDPHDARSVAIAALRSPAPVEVRAEDHSAVAKLWSKRQRDLGRNRNKVACRLHSVLCDLVAGGVPDEITVGKAAKLLASVHPDSAVAAARVELAGDLIDDLRRLDDQVKESKRRLAAVVKAARTSTTRVFGVGPVVAATTIGITGDVNRFPNRDHFASFNGTAPIDVSSGGKKVYRLSRRGSRHLNHAIHMAAVTQIRHRHSEGRAYYDRKVAEGKGHKEALRCLKRRISDALYACMVEDAKRDGRWIEKGPGGQPGNDSDSSATGSHPETPALRTSHSRTQRHLTTPRQATTRTSRNRKTKKQPTTRKTTRRVS